MANVRSTKVGFCRAVYLCLLALLLPGKLIKAQEADETGRKGFPQSGAPREHSAYLVRRALWSSLVLMLASAAVGYVLGQLIGILFGPVPRAVIMILQVSGAMVLLWATLFVRGWDIQTSGGVTLTERVNRWVYLALCCLGTAAIICSLGL